MPTSAMRRSHRHSSPMPNIETTEGAIQISGPNGLFNDDMVQTISDVEIARNTIFSGGRPSNFINTMQMSTAFWQPYAMMDFYMREVSILATIRSRSVTEIFRYGLDWEPEFVCKCSDCGHEYQETTKKCEICGSLKIVRPDESQKDYFVRPNGKSFFEEANDSGQSLKAVLQSYAESQYQNNMAYLLCVTGDVVNPDGTIEHQYPLELVTIDPKFVRRMFDESAVPGREMGFLPEDRSVGISIEGNPLLMTEDGKHIIPAYYRVGSSFGGTGNIWYYGKDEMYCDNWFSPSQTYGIPPWLDIEDDILSYHYMEKHQLKRWQYGYVRGLLVFPGFNRQSMDNMAKSIQKVLAKNDNSIPMIALPPAVPGAGEQKVQFVSLTGDTASDLMTYKNDIRDRLCARAGVPNLIVTDTENSGGLNSESLQITSFDRYLMDKYDHVDDPLDWFLTTFFPKITDWRVRLVRPPKMNTELKQKQEEAQYAMTMKNLGFRILSQKNGRIEISDTPDMPNPMAMGGFGGGGLPFDNGGRNPSEDTLDDESILDSEDDTGEEDVSETSDIDEWEEDAEYQASIRKQYAGFPSRQYLKTWSEVAYDKYLAKDAYGFLYGHEDELIAVLSAGKEVSQYFKTLNPDQVKEVYRIIVYNLEEVNWSPRKMVDELMEKFPFLEEYQAQRIIQTEVARTIFYAKEQSALREDLGAYNYGWQGPLDKRTTPMCYYMQTGKLRPSDYKALEKAGHTADELPTIPPEGLPLEELKEACRQTAYCFGFDMISDWVMHINCRHSFIRGNRALEPQEVDDEQLQGLLDAVYDYEEDSAPFLDNEDAYPMAVTLEADNELWIERMYDNYDAYLFPESINGKPTLYDSGADTIFVFDDMNEREALAWVRMIIELRREGIDDVSISWVMSDDGSLTEEVQTYLLAHADEYWERAQLMGWYFG